VAGKSSDTRIRPLPLTTVVTGTRHITVTREREIVSVGEWPLHAGIIYNRLKFLTVSLLKRLRNGRFISETAVRREAAAVSEGKQSPGSRSR
jgi:hypothetical protein